MILIAFIPLVTDTAHIPVINAILIAKNNLMEFHCPRNTFEIGHGEGISD